jgi:hypothetical protein
LTISPKEKGCGDTCLDHPRHPRVELIDLDRILLDLSNPNRGACYNSSRGSGAFPPTLSGSGNLGFPGDGSCRAMQKNVVCVCDCR